MKLYLPDKVTDIQSLNVNFERGTSGTEQRGGSKVVVYGCSNEFCNETLDLEGKISQTYYVGRANPSVPFRLFHRPN